MDNNPTKRSHFLPQMVLNRFTDESDGLVWVYDRETDTYRKQNVINTAVINNYYKYFGKDGEYHNDLEGFFSTIEGEAKTPIDKFGKQESLNNSEKERLAVYVAYQRVRVPHFANQMQVLSDKLYKAVNKRIFYNEEQAKHLIEKYNKDKNKNIELDPKVFLETIQDENYKMIESREYEIEMMLKSGLDHINYFMQMDWKIIFSPNNGAFITSDNPFVLFSPTEHNPFGGVGIITKGAVKAIPLSKDFYLAIFDKGNELGFYKCDRKHCRHINDTVALNCDRFVYSHSKELLKSVVERVKLKERVKKDSVVVG